MPIATAEMLAGGDDADGRRGELSAHLRKRTTNAVWQLLSANAIAIIVGAFVLARVEERVFGRNAIQGLPRFGIIIVVFAVIFGIARVVATRAQKYARARLAVAAGFCGSCGYDLSHLESAGDECTVCPECGSAWRRSER